MDLRLQALTLVLACLVFAAGCAKDYYPSECDALDPEFYTETSDPFESVNRAIFNFNLVLDEHILNPAVVAYQQNVSPGVQGAINNFSNNLKEPRNITAALLMGEFTGAAESGTRFLFNSTFGLLGTIDAGGMAGVPYTDYTFSHMFGRWGIHGGPYMVLPVLGPANARDSVGRLVHLNYTDLPSQLDSSNTRTAVQLGLAFNERVQIQSMMRMLDNQLDPYLFVRESYRQSQLNRICNP